MHSHCIAWCLSYELSILHTLEDKITMFLLMFLLSRPHNRLQHLVAMKIPNIIGKSTTTEM